MFFKPHLVRDFRLRCKRSGHLWSKQRFLSMPLGARAREGRGGSGGAGEGALVRTACSRRHCGVQALRARLLFVSSVQSCARVKTCEERRALHRVPAKSFTFEQRRGGTEPVLGCRVSASGYQTKTASREWFTIVCTPLGH